jgi:all-trans-retinol 13,14-reductase
MDPVDQFHLPDGSTFAVPADYDTYIARLKGEFPGECEAIGGFCHHVRRLYLLGVLKYFEGVTTGRLEGDRSLSVRDALDRWFRSPRLKLLLTADCPHWGAPPSRTSFVFYAMLRLSYFLGNYYPRGGSQSFADELARRFEEQGGHILLKSKVFWIVTRRGRAVGIEVETGPHRDRFRRVVTTNVVVSNADLRQTALKMVARDDIEPEYLERLRELRLSYPCFLLHMGVEGVSANLLERIHGYHWRKWDAERVGTDAFRFKLFVPTLYEPGLAPPGRHVLIIQKVTEIDFDAIDDWASHKLALEEEVMAYLQDLLTPSTRIVVRLSASAMTSNRFTLNDGGAMLGWEMSPDQLGSGRPDVCGPIRGMYLVGQLFLKNYAQRWVEAHRQGKPDTVLAYSAPDFRSQRRGRWRLEDERDLGAAVRTSLKSEGSESVDLTGIADELREYFAGITAVDSVKCNIDLIEHADLESSAVITVKYILGGEGQDGKLIEDRFFFRWWLKKVMRPSGLSEWRVAGDELVNGERVAGRGDGFLRPDPNSIGVDYVHHRDPKLDPTRAKLKFGVIQYASGGVSAVDYDDGRPDLFFSDGVRSRLVQERHRRNGHSSISRRHGRNRARRHRSSALRAVLRRRPRRVPRPVRCPVHGPEPAVQEPRRRHFRGYYDPLRPRFHHAGHLGGVSRLQRGRASRSLCGEQRERVRDLAQDSVLCNQRRA